MVTAQILNSHSLARLRQEVKKTNIRSYTTLKKAELVKLMLQNAEKFSHIKQSLKPPRALKKATKPDEEPKPKKKPAEKKKGLTPETRGKMTITNIGSPKAETAKKSSPTPSSKQSTAQALAEMDPGIGKEPAKKEKKDFNVDVPMFTASGRLGGSDKPMGVEKDDLLENIDGSSGLKYKTKAQLLKLIKSRSKNYGPDGFWKGALGAPIFEAFMKQKKYVEEKYNPPKGIVAVRRAGKGIEMLKSPLTPAKFRKEFE